MPCLQSVHLAWPHLSAPGLPLAACSARSLPELLVFGRGWPAAAIAQLHSCSDYHRLAPLGVQPPPAAGPVQAAWSPQACAQRLITVL